LIFNALKGIAIDIFPRKVLCSFRHDSCCNGHF